MFGCMFTEAQSVVR